MQKDSPLKIYFEKPATGESLSIFRILIGLYGIIQALILRPDFGDFVSDKGWLNWDISQAFTMPWQPHIKYVAHLFSFLGIPSSVVPDIIYYLFLLSLFFLIAGLFTRMAALLSWLLFWIISSSMRMYTYGADYFLQLALFYMIFMPVNKTYSLDNLFGFATNAPSYLVTFSQRVMQLHLCLVYFFSGMSKVHNPLWLDGNGVWAIIYHSDWASFNFSWMASVPIIPQLVGIAVIALEVFYLVCMWIPRVRSYWFVLISLMHIGIGFVLGIPMFAAIMIIFSFSAWYNDILADAIWRLKPQPRKAVSAI
jgi:hypothetical protein